MKITKNKKNKNSDDKMHYTAEIISVGTEILLGDILNTNSRYLSQQLASLGVNVYYQTTVGDNGQRLEDALNLALTRSDIVILSGGLGPTKDDLTKEKICNHLKIDLILDEKALENINDYFKKIGKTPNDNNIKQAYVPAFSNVLYNENGTAPGAIIEKSNKIIIMLPGPPNELKPMFENNVRQFIQKKTKDTIVSKMVRVFGIGESSLEGIINDLIENSNPTVALYAKSGEVHIRVSAKSDSFDSATKMCQEICDELKNRLTDNIYSTNDESLEKVVVSQLYLKNLRLTTAESCTGGLISKKITDIPGSSNVFDCGIVSYGNNIKSEILNVSENTLKTQGAVSPSTASDMALGVLKISHADIAVSVTGIAGPDGGTTSKPVGLVYIGLADKKDNVYIKKIITGHENDRDYIREVTSLNALDLIRRYLINPELINDLKYSPQLNKFIGEGNTKNYGASFLIPEKDENDKSSLDKKIDSILNGLAIGSVSGMVANNKIPDINPFEDETFNLSLDEKNPENMLTSENNENNETSVINKSQSSDTQRQFIFMDDNQNIVEPDNNNESDNDAFEYVSDDEDYDEFQKKKPWYKKIFNYLIPRRSDSSSEIIRKIIFLIALPVFIISAFLVGKYYYDSYQHSKLNEDISKAYVEDISIPETEKTALNYPDDYIDKFFSLYKMNKDIKGYLTIGDIIDYPIVQSPDNDYYLRRSFLGEKTDYGVPFFDFRNDIKKPSTNLIIYGHNMHDGKIFNPLLKYKDINFYNKNSTIKMDTVYGEGKWKVFAMYVANANSKNGPTFDYHNFIEPKSEEDFNKFIKKVNKRTILNTGVDVKYGDQLLTLSTCSYEFDDARFVVMARKVRDGENENVISSKVSVNSEALYPDIWYTLFPDATKPDGYVPGQNEDSIGSTSVGNTSIDNATNNSFNSSLQNSSNNEPNSANSNSNNNSINNSQSQINSQPPSSPPDDSASSDVTSVPDESVSSDVTPPPDESISSEPPSSLPDEPASSEAPSETPSLSDDSQISEAPPSSPDEPVSQETPSLDDPSI